MSTDIDKHMSALERRANVVRSRLLRTVDALDTRRHQVERVGAKAKEVAPKVGIALAALAAVSIGSVAAIVGLVRSRRRQKLGRRVSALVTRFRAPAPPSLASQAIQRVTLTFVTMLATEVSRRTVKNLVDGRLPDGRLPVGRALDAHHDALKG